MLTAVCYQHENKTPAQIVFSHSNTFLNTLNPLLTTWRATYLPTIPLNLGDFSCLEGNLVAICHQTTLLTENSSRMSSVQSLPESVPVTAVSSSRALRIECRSFGSRCKHSCHLRRRRLWLQSAAISNSHCASELHSSYTLSWQFVTFDFFFSFFSAELCRVT